MIASFHTTVASEYNKLAPIEEKHVHKMDVYEHATLMSGKEFFELIMNWHDELTKKITGKKDNENENDQEF